ncbi:MAG: PH domain-containing protein [Pseudomonadota bacterium]
MAGDKIDLEPGEEILFQARPAWKTFWVFIFGAALCGFGPFLQENPPLSIGGGLALAAVFVLIIWRRWSNTYTLTNRRLRVFGGLFYREGYDIKLADISDVQSNQGLTLKLVGSGHLLIRSRLSDQENMIMYGQPDPFTLRDRLLALAEDARGGIGKSPGLDAA